MGHFAVVTSKPAYDKPLMYFIVEIVAGRWVYTGQKFTDPVQANEACEQRNRERE